MIQRPIQAQGGLNAASRFSDVSNTLRNVGDIWNRYQDREQRKEALAYDREQQRLANERANQQLALQQAAADREAVKFAGDLKSAELLSGIPTVSTTEKVVSPAVPASTKQYITNPEEVLSAVQAQEEASKRFDTEYQKAVEETKKLKSAEDGKTLLYPTKRGTPGYQYTLMQTAEGKIVPTLDRWRGDYKVVDEDAVKDYYVTNPDEVGRLALARAGIQSPTGRVLLQDIKPEYRTENIPAKAAVTEEIRTPLTREEYRQQGVQLLQNEVKNIQNSDLSEKEKNIRLRAISKAQEGLAKNIETLYGKENTPSAALYNVRNKLIEDQATVADANALGFKGSSVTAAKEFIKNNFKNFDKNPAKAKETIAKIIGQSGNPEEIKDAYARHLDSGRPVSEFLEYLYTIGGADMKDLGWFDFGKKDLGDVTSYR